MNKIIPEHIAIIMDGNRRWARCRGLKVWQGHKAGYKKAKEVMDWCRETGIKILTLYAFSNENWQRSKKEVNFLMNLFYFFLTKDINELNKNGIRLQVIGRKENLSKKIKKAIEKAEILTKKNKASILNLAIDYGAREELVDAFKKIIKNLPSKIDVDLISQNLYTAGLPDPDLIIRTSGEMRLSNFLLWQAAYSELYFCKKYWPDFSKKDFNAALADFAKRQRRFGK